MIVILRAARLQALHLEFIGFLRIDCMVVLFLAIEVPCFHYIQHEYVSDH